MREQRCGSITPTCAEPPAWYFITKPSCRHYFDVYASLSFFLKMILLNVGKRDSVATVKVMIRVDKWPEGLTSFWCSTINQLLGHWYQPEFTLQPQTAYATFLTLQSALVVEKSMGHRYRHHYSTSPSLLTPRIGFKIIRLCATHGSKGDYSSKPA